MTNIGSQTISPLQWYKGIASELWRGFQLTTKVNLKLWWKEHKELPVRISIFQSIKLLTTEKHSKNFISCQAFF
ncbi:hypothetical protein H1P_2800001 [Hyella patelloides LEGE 07179]|uniref:Uncharacterized protein n=1 Tax=Hyella patelloides LEGE 07179 TaxID=945734 RepID=A0A563VTC7_9CYAN|nr:hypothetical protein H1P_2800001 [Hyella patelloides LEGE 07179]